MKVLVTFVLAFAVVGSRGYAQDLGSKARQMEKEGDASGAQTMLRSAAQSASADSATLIAYAEFLDTHHDPEARAMYERVLKTLNRPQDRPRLEAVTRRLLALDVTAGDNEAAVRHFEMARNAGGSEVSIDGMRNRKTV